MYMVMTLENYILTNAGRVDLTTDGLIGMIPVFKEKDLAVEHSKKCANAKILKIEFNSNIGNVLGEQK